MRPSITMFSGAVLSALVLATSTARAHDTGDSGDSGPDQPSVGQQSHGGLEQSSGSGEGRDLFSNAAAQGGHGQAHGGHEDSGHPMDEKEDGEGDIYPPKGPPPPPGMVTIMSQPPGKADEVNTTATAERSSESKPSQAPKASGSSSEHDHATSALGSNDPTSTASHAVTFESSFMSGNHYFPADPTATSSSSSSSDGINIMMTSRTGSDPTNTVTEKGTKTTSSASSGHSTESSGTASPTATNEKAAAVRTGASIAAVVVAAIAVFVA